MDFLVCGLGNPGPRYASTRHNVGFAVVERVAEITATKLRKRWWRPYRIGVTRVDERSIFLIQPLTYMNNSGDVVPDLFRSLDTGPESFVVVCDTLDLPAGQARMKRKGSSAGHRGLQSIIDTIGHGNFVRFYVGVGRPEDKEGVIEYVLNTPEGEEQRLIDRCLTRTANAIVSLADSTIDSVIQSFNAKGHD